jgi:LysR family transcriptional regulator, glycine cleavage system transcriptional activator
MRQLPSFFSLRAFESAARHESFTFAAQELHQTTSAISHQVRSLESWLGLLLFVRHARRVGLTPDGRRLLENLTPAFDMIENACAALRPRGQERVLSVHCSPSFATQWLGPRLGRFMQAHPSTTIRLSSSAEPADLRREDTVDVDIAYGAPPERAGIVVEPLGLEAIVPMCSPRLVAGRTALTPADCIRLVLIDSRLNPVRWADWCALNALKLPDRARPSFDRGSLAIAAAVDGLGVALETTRFAQAELAKGDLTVLDGPSFLRMERETHFLCYRRANRDSPRVIAFRHWLYSEWTADPAKPGLIPSPASVA